MAGHHARAGWPRFCKAARMLRTGSFLAIVSTFFVSTPLAHAHEGEPFAPINAVAGDASWMDRYGRAPNLDDVVFRDDERHRVHLEWIERKLRGRSTDALPAAQREMRARLLDALAEYRQRGVHPVNDRSTRLPRWLDREGRICAVGYLMEVSAGRAFVERINARWEYDFLMSIDDPELDAWIASSGFTKEELASIQPTGYTGLSLSAADIDPDPWIAAIGGGVLLGLNVTLISLDFVFARRPGPLDRRLPIAQLIFGIAQLVGAAVTFAVAGQADFGEPMRGPLLGGAAIASAFATFDIGFASVALANPDL